MAYVLVFLADWANGIFAVLIASYLTGVEVAWWHFLLGILASHAIDLDAIPELVRRGRVASSSEHAGDHRDGLHYPLTVLPVLFGVALVVGYWGYVLLIAVFLHFINDLYGTGWGIKIFWPFSSRSYKVPGRRANQLKKILVDGGEWEKLPEEERKLRFVVSWSKEEMSEYVRRWGIDNWIEPYYLRINWVNIIEFGLFLMAVILMIMTLS